MHFDHFLLSLTLLKLRIGCCRISSGLISLKDLNIRECGKMWWSTEKTCDANSLSALYEFPLFILDEIGGQAVCSSLLCAQMHNGAPSYIKPVVLKNDLCEDG